IQYRIINETAKERQDNMLENDLIFKNPLKLMGYETEDILPDGGFGAVLASAGVGKTALLVQLSLYALLKQKNVLHISLDDPVNKVDLWYKEVFHNLARQYNIEQTASLWEAMLPHRFIMTFKVEGFSAPILEERLNDLTQHVVLPFLCCFIDYPILNRYYLNLFFFVDEFFRNRFRHLPVHGKFHGELRLTL
ncbi:AAA family ATPase, partial [Thermodesulfobacteriota bacterium]